MQAVHIIGNFCRKYSQTTDIAQVAAFLASDDNTWVTGQYIEVSGGFRL